MGAQLSLTKDLRAFQDHWLTGSMKLIGNMTEATSHYLIQVGKVLAAVFRHMCSASDLILRQWLHTPSKANGPLKVWSSLNFTAHTVPARPQRKGEDAFAFRKFTVLAESCRKASLQDSRHPEQNFHRRGMHEITQGS